MIYQALLWRALFFCTRSLRQSGRLWWKMGEQYSRTGLIAVHWKSTNIFKAQVEPKKKYKRLFAFLIVSFSIDQISG